VGSSPTPGTNYRCGVSLNFQEHVVALFPGQGSISPGAGQVWQSSEHWSLVDEISETTKKDIANLLLEADENEIVLTDNAQLGTFTLSMIAWKDYLAHHAPPRYLLGHSLGEFSALVASGLISLEDGAKLISLRGAAMARAASLQDGSMVALMGPNDDALSRLKNLRDVWIANINGPGQIVVSGTRNALAAILENYKDLGWKRATPLSVSGAFHSPLMEPAQAELDAALKSVKWGATDHVLIANVDGRQHNQAQDWALLLSQQMTSPVQFLNATMALPESISTSIEFPPGNVLTGLTKRIRSFVQQKVLSSPDEIEGD
jgi:[acyl-carrier-protein] S-malonyltransferase